MYSMRLSSGPHWRAGRGYTIFWLFLIGVNVTPAIAQEAGAPPPDVQKVPAGKVPKDGDDSQSVIVQGARPQNPPQNQIDRQSYDNTKNIDQATGTAADALNKVPSVNVDPNGNLTVRGNSNVQILVDGKPSAMFAGDNRAAALQAMASSEISSIEVMTNPGAQYSSGGSGGIINLVTSKNRKTGASGTFVAAFGSDGRYNSSLTGTYRKNKLSYTGSASYRYDDRRGRSSTVLQRRASNGNALDTTQTGGTTRNRIDSISASGGLEYSASDRETLGAQGTYARRELDTDLDTASSQYDAGNALVGRYQRLSRFKGPHEDGTIALNWTHIGDSKGEALKADLRLARSYGTGEADNRNTYDVPGASVSTDYERQNSDLKSRILSIDYNRMLGDDQVTLGMQMVRDTYGSVYASNGSDPTHTQSSAFAYTQTLGAAYATIQHQFGDRWTVLGGLRSETIDLDTNLITSGTTSQVRYTKLSPSLFATYGLSPYARIRLSFSHRLQRPSPLDLNPYLIYVDAQTVSAGNPNLRPQGTDSFEAGYEYAQDATSYQIRGYYRHNDNVIVGDSHFIAPNVLLTTKRNAGSGEAGGVEFNLSTKPGKKLALTASGDISLIRLSAASVGGIRSGLSIGGKLGLDYAATAKSRYQLTYTETGKQLTGQGYRLPMTNASLAYRYALDSKTSFVVSVTDVMRSTKGLAVIDTVAVHNEQIFSQRGQNIVIGLTYALGGNGKK